MRRRALIVFVLACVVLLSAAYDLRDDSVGPKQKGRQDTGESDAEVGGLSVESAVIGELTTHCGDEINVTRLVACYHTYRMIGSQALARAQYYMTGCQLPNITAAHAYACYTYGLAESFNVYWQDRKDRDELCKLTLSRSERCKYGCGNATWGVCMKHVAPSVPFKIVYSFYQAFDTAKAGRQLIDVKVGLAIGRALRTTMHRHGAMLLANLLLVPMYFRETGPYIRLTCGIGSVALYLSISCFVQAVISFGTTLALMSGQAKNVNNPAIVGIGTMLLFAIPVVDAVNEWRISLFVTCIVVGVVIVTVSALLSKRLYIDIITIGYVVQVGLNIMFAYRRIIKAKSGTDPFIATMAYAISAALPYGTPFSSFFLDAVRTSVEFAARLAAILDVPEAVDTFVLVAFIARYACWVLLRTVLGVQVTHKLRGMSLGDQAFRGFLLVWTDKLAPLEILRSILAKRALPSFSFAVVSTALQVSEFVYATELYFLGAIIAFIFWCVDYAPARINKVLRASQCAFEDGAFKCIDAMPWADIDHLFRIRQGCVTVKAQVGGGVKVGAGLVTRFAGACKLYTVKHVVAEADSVTAICGDEEMKVNTAHLREWDSGGSDPVITAHLELQDAPELSVLSKTEVGMVSYLAVLHRDGFINWVSNFKFGNGYIEMGVDLMTGDSGSPVIAVLKGGKLRYAGAVSRGTFDAGKANVASSAISDGGIGSAGTSSPTSAEVTMSMAAGDQAADVLASRIEAETQIFASKEATRNKVKEAKKKARVLVEALMAIPSVTINSDWLMAAIDEGRAVRFNRTRSGQAFNFNWVYGGTV